MESNELKHYGVKGMKWGVRRSQAALDRAAGRRASTPKARKKEASGLSNQELQSRIQRIRLEQEYVRLTSQPTLLDRGKKQAASVLKSKGGQIVNKQLDRQLNRMVDASVDSLFGRPKRSKG